jgi:hypothetical protein
VELRPGVQALIVSCQQSVWSAAEALGFESFVYESTSGGSTGAVLNGEICSHNRRVKGTQVAKRA